ncbi:DUF2490 domain-containing protein [Flavobacterium soli]|uniref:DUF2490 domain-containing protein n=1 Tax=Flavobacterium soli TaxID=344881 RepID=UPI00040F5A74|nr:DUF2490 domain-containing protein [Flavobacterium soli]
MKTPSTLLVLFVFLLCGTAHISAQNRTKEYNNIGWFAYTGTFRLNDKLGVHTEYQWRRDDYIEHWQQGLLRLGLNYNFLPEVQVRVGYAWAETYPYGETPLNGMGKDFTEHRIYEMLTLQDRIGRVNLSHRFMLEQRWVGRYSDAALEKEDEFPFLNRARYMLRLQIPLKGTTVQDKTPYVVLYDEVFIGFGKNVGENIFDQNRLGVLFGYRFNKHFQMEGGYLNQVVQLGREIDNKNAFQYNNGFIVSTIVNLDLRKSNNENN